MSFDCVRTPLKFCLVAFALGTPCEASDLSKFLHELFDDAYGRPPTGAELNYQTGIYQSGGPLASQVAILSSDDYFYNRCRGDYRVFVTNIHQYFVHRPPREDELRYWANEFRRAGNQRRDVLWRFCSTAGVTQLPSFPGSQPGYGVTQTRRQLADELVRQANALYLTVRSDLGGSQWGKVVEARTQVLLNTSRSYRESIRSNTATERATAVVGQSVARAIQNLSDEFRRYPGASPRGEAILRRIQQIFESARQAPLPDYQDPWPGWQPPSRPGNPAQGNQYPWEAVQNLKTVTEQFAADVERNRYQNPYYEYLYRDLQGLAVQIEAVQQLIRQQAGRGRVQRALGDVQRSAASLRDRIGRGDVASYRGWQNVTYALNQVNSAMGFEATTYTEPGRAVIASRPVWNNFPVSGSQTVAPLQRNQQLVRLTDELLTSLDQFISLLRSESGQTASATALMNRLLDLQHAAINFRQSATQGDYGSTLRADANGLRLQYRYASTEFLQVVAENPSLNSPLFRDVGETVERIARQTGS